MKENHPGYKTQAMRDYRQKVRIAHLAEREERKRQKDLVRLSRPIRYKKQNLMRRFRSWINKDGWVSAIQEVFLSGSQVYAQTDEGWRYGKILLHVNFGDSYAVRIEFADCIIDYDYHYLDPQDGLVRLV